MAARKGLTMARRGDARRSGRRAVSSGVSGAVSAPRAVAPDRVAEPSRGTFRVARALDRLAVSLPDVVVRNSTRRQAGVSPSQNQRRSRIAAPSPNVPLSARMENSRPRNVPSEAGKARLEGARPDNPCKARPTSNKPKAGGGGSRSFVPWCKK